MYEDAPRGRFAPENPLVLQSSFYAGHFTIIVYPFHSHKNWLRNRQEWANLIFG